MNPARPLFIAAAVLGVALAAFFDGIMLHQVLNWHHMICEERSCHPLSIADLQAKTHADGLFHLAAFAVAITGVHLLFRAGGVRAPGVALPGATFAGGLLTGFGGFNVIEGIVDHHILGIHHVRFGANRDVYDIAFLIISLLIFQAGMVLTKRARAAQGAGVAETGDTAP